MRLARFAVTGHTVMSKRFTTSQVSLSATWSFSRSTKRSSSCFRQGVCLWSDLTPANRSEKLNVPDIHKFIFLVISFTPKSCSWGTFSWLRCIYYYEMWIAKLSFCRSKAVEKRNFSSLSPSNCFYCSSFLVSVEALRWQVPFFQNEVSTKVLNGLRIFGILG
jgi:hypothetical protein